METDTACAQKEPHSAPISSGTNLVNKCTSVSTLKNLRYRLMFKNQYFLFGSSSPSAPPVDDAAAWLRPLFSVYEPTARTSNQGCRSVKQNALDSDKHTVSHIYAQMVCQKLCAAMVVSWSHSDLTSWDLVTHFASGTMCRQLRICNSIILLHQVIAFAASPETYRKAAHLETAGQHWPVFHQC